MWRYPIKSLITAAARALDPIQRCRFANRLEVRELPVKVRKRWFLADHRPNGDPLSD